MLCSQDKIDMNENSSLKKKKKILWKEIENSNFWTRKHESTEADTEYAGCTSVSFPNMWSSYYQLFKAKNCVFCVWLQRATQWQDFIWATREALKDSLQVSNCYFVSIMWLLKPYSKSKHLNSATVLTVKINWQNQKIFFTFGKTKKLVIKIMFC